MVILPPDELVLERIENVLRDQTAANYFFDYLQKCCEDFKKKNFIDSEKKAAKSENYCRLYALYIDIRCFDEELKKMKKTLTMK